MSRCDHFREDLAAHVYGDLPADAASALEAHLAECAGCREELRGLQRAAAALGDDVMFPREREVDWDAFAASTLRRAIGSRGRPRRTPAGLGAWIAQVLRAPGWAAAAAGLILVAGVAIGSWGAMMMRAPAGSAGQPAQPTARLAAPGNPPGEDSKVILPAAMLDDIQANTAKAGTERYLAESRALLTSLLAMPVPCAKGKGEDDKVDIAAERQKSLQLLRRQRLIADQLKSLPLARAREVSDDLEQVFLEILSFSDCAHAEQLVDLRNLVEKRQLMLRLKLLIDEMARSGARNA